jgi:hypothetical protein
MVKVGWTRATEVLVLGGVEKELGEGSERISRYYL